MFISTRLGAALLLLLLPLAAQAEKRPKMVVLSVRPIDDAVRTPAQVLTEMIATDLSKTGRFELISESEIGSMIGFERQKALLGCTETSCLAEIGGALGCDYLLIGTLGSLGEQMRLDLKIADARRNKIVAREGALVASAGQLASVQRAALQSVLSQLGGAPVPAAHPDSGIEARGTKSGVAPYVLLGVGAAGLLGGAALAAQTLSSKTELTYAEANTRASAGLWIGGAGAVAMVVGLVWALGAGDEPVAAVGLAPGSDGLGVVAAGRF